MYQAWFVNQNTGELYRSGSPSNDKCRVFYPAVNAEGWSQIGFEMYQLLKTVQGFGFCKGVESEMELNPLKFSDKRHLTYSRKL